MKKYFGNKQEWTIEELKTLVSNNPQLGFYYEDSILCPVNKTITIHNWNNGFKGKNTRTFAKRKNGMWTKE